MSKSKRLYCRSVGEVIDAVVRFGLAWSLHGDRSRLPLYRLRDPFVLRFESAQLRADWLLSRIGPRSRVETPQIIPPVRRRQRREGGIPRGNRLHPIRVGKLRFSARRHAYTLARARIHALPRSNLTRTPTIQTPVSSVHPPAIPLTFFLFYFSLSLSLFSFPIAKRTQFPSHLGGTNVSRKNSSQRKGRIIYLFKSRSQLQETLKKKRKNEVAHQTVSLFLSTKYVLSHLIIGA